MQSKHLNHHINKVGNSKVKSVMFSRINACFSSALSKGSLVFTEFTTETITDSATGIPFQVKFAPNLAKKPTGGLKPPTSMADDPTSKPAAVPAKFNPFLEPDKDLHVLDFEKHRLLL
jgi:hypothetical protein